MSKSIVHVPWTDEQFRILREEFPKGIQAAMAALPDHTECAIRTRASNMGIKLNKDALLQARGPSEHKILAVLRATPGMKMAEIADRTGYTKASLHNRMTQMKKRGSIFCEGVNSQTIWFAEKPAAMWDGINKGEFLQAASIWQVGYRVARDMGALA